MFCFSYNKIKKGTRQVLTTPRLQRKTIMVSVSANKSTSLRVDPRDTNIQAHCILTPTKRHENINATPCLICIIEKVDKQLGQFGQFTSN